MSQCCRNAYRPVDSNHWYVKRRLVLLAGAAAAGGAPGTGSPVGGPANLANQPGFDPRSGLLPPGMQGFSFNLGDMLRMAGGQHQHHQHHHMHGHHPLGQTPLGASHNMCSISIVSALLPLRPANLMLFAMLLKCLAWAAELLASLVLQELTVPYLIVVGQT